MATDLINENEARCVNNRCGNRINCKRYMQLKIDKHVDRKNTFITRYDVPEMRQNINCNYQIPIENV